MRPTRPLNSITRRSTATWCSDPSISTWTLIATVDPYVMIEEQRNGYVRYRLSMGNDEVHGICDKRGDCTIGAVIDTPDGPVQIRDHQHLGSCRCGLGAACASNPNWTCRWPRRDRLLPGRAAENREAMATSAKFYLRDGTTTATRGRCRRTTGGDQRRSGATGDASGDSENRSCDNRMCRGRRTRTQNDISVDGSGEQQRSARWGRRRFVSPPLAGSTFAAGDGNWTFSCGQSKSKPNHNMSAAAIGYGRPSRQAL